MVSKIDIGASEIKKQMRLNQSRNKGGQKGAAPPGKKFCPFYTAQRAHPNSLYLYGSFKMVAYFFEINRNLGEEQTNPKIPPQKKIFLPPLGQRFSGGTGLNNGKKMRTASLNSKFIGSCKSAVQLSYAFKS